MKNLIYKSPEMDIMVFEAEDNYDPSTNMNVEVYGPPEWFGITEDGQN
ncbi:MAG: hypothetical protein IJM37_11795 [Lachnospiraceae bacterium]|nr:hypothetical protein [Lachnospiraceae bacterium]